MSIIYKESKLQQKKVLCIACAGGSGDGIENTLTAMKYLITFLHMEAVDYIGITKKNFQINQTQIQNSTRALL